MPSLFVAGLFTVDTSGATTRLAETHAGENLADRVRTSFHVRCILSGD